MSGRLRDANLLIQQAGHHRREAIHRLYPAHSHEFAKY
ncbi:hypothetical protein W04_1597 [Pseudoalteromonas sp. SW0106-04]|nr:hypothetical protein W04_1597 [Pseudoalteromonas sp. SW0106-04]